MWDDLPKAMPSGTKITIIIIVIIIIAVLGYTGWTLFSPKKSPSSNSPSPFQSLKTSGLPTNATSEISPSPTISPSPIVSVDLKIPEGEILVTSSSADTNGDRKEEFLVITKMPNNKFHAYVLSNDGNLLFDNKELDRAPVRIVTQIYDSNKESYLSWMLVFTEQSGDLAFIHWDGTKYEIPASTGI